MAEPREPEQIRQDCARKLSEVKVSDQFTAMRGCLLDDDWTSPRIEELFLSPDHCPVVRVAGQTSHKTFG